MEGKVGLLQVFYSQMMEDAESVYRSFHCSGSVTFLYGSVSSRFFFFDGRIQQAQKPTAPEHLQFLLICSHVAVRLMINCSNQPAQGTRTLSTNIYIGTVGIFLAVGSFKEGTLETLCNTPNELLYDSTLELKCALENRIQRGSRGRRRKWRRTPTEFQHFMEVIV
jgi:hypothetical protein